MPQDAFKLVDEAGKPLGAATPPSANGLNLVDESGKALAPAVSVTLDYGNGNTDQSDWLGSAVTFGKHFLSSANPVPVDLLKSIYEHGNVETAKGILGAQGAQFDKAKDAFHQGNYLDAARYTMGWLIPLIGPGANAAGDELGRGEYAAGLGDMTGLAAQPLVASGLGKLGKAGKAAIPSKLNPVQEAAVAFADREGIPLDVATRTGNETARAVQNVASKQLGGAGVAADARTAQTAALAKTADTLKNRVEPNLGNASFTPETAAETVVGSAQKRAARFGAKAGDAYDVLRLAEADPQNAKTIIALDGTPKDVPMATDMRGVKQALQPIYDELKQRLPIAQQQANPGLKAIENVLSGEDFVPASVAESNLGAMKAIVRDTKSPQAARLASQAIDALDGEIMATVQQAAPVVDPVTGHTLDVGRALERGRALTRAKYDTLGVLKDLKANDANRFEPAKTFDLLTNNRDTRITLLRRVAKQAPQDLPKLGRAFVEGLFNKAQSEGGFDRTAGISRDWESLGAESKNLMFKNPGLVSDLDNFFRIAKKLSENPNPSGTAATLAAWTGAGLVITNPFTGVPLQLGSNAVARMLFNPKAARALSEGFQIPINAAGAGKTAAASYLLKLAGEQGKRIQQPEAVPAY